VVVGVCGRYLDISKAVIILLSASKKKKRWLNDAGPQLSGILQKIINFRVYIYIYIYIYKRVSEKSYVETGKSQQASRERLPESSKWKVLMMTIIGASVHHGSNQSMITISYAKAEENFAFGFCMVNGN
jgi:hypothetical protein